MYFIIIVILLQASSAQPTIIGQKFGNARATPSPNALLGHEGKYTPSSSVPDLAQRFVIATFTKES